MSWNINIVGKPENVSAAVTREQYVPDELKSVVAIFAKTVEAAPNSSRPVAIQVKSSGHIDTVSGWSSINDFSIVTLVLAPDPITGSGTTG